MQSATMVAAEIWALAAGVAGCASMGTERSMAKAMSGGSLPLPGTYRSWPGFLANTHKAEVGKIREIYLNPVAHTA